MLSPFIDQSKSMAMTNVTEVGKCNPTACLAGGEPEMLVKGSNEYHSPLSLALLWNAALK